MKLHSRTAYVLAATGFNREAQLISGPGVRAVVSGGDLTALAERLKGAIAQVRPVGVISIGLCGALSPNLELGGWVVGRTVLRATRPGPHDKFEPARFPTDSAWASRLLDRLPDAAFGDIAGENCVIASADAKAKLHNHTGALAVDMESHVAAAFARAHDLPLAVLRVVSDLADQSLPKAVKVAMSPGGGVNFVKVALSALADPRQIPALIRTGRKASVAFSTLLRCNDLLGGAGIGCPYLGELPLDVA